jgi:hypothetical protein
LSDVGSSKIDPQTILISLDRGNTGIFQLESGIPENPKFVMNVEWTQADFFRVATAFSQTVWKEAFDDWNLYRMNYYAECKDDPKGLSDAQFYFYKWTIVYARKTLSVRAIHIDPEYGYVAWGSDNNWRPPLFGWKTINLDKVTIPVEEAILIAEGKGGMDFRKSAENVCQILVNMNPEIYKRNDWQVMYGGGEDFWIPSK